MRSALVLIGVSLFLLALPTALGVEYIEQEIVPGLNAWGAQGWNILHTATWEATGQRAVITDDDRLLTELFEQGFDCGFSYIWYNNGWRIHAWGFAPQFSIYPDSARFVVCDYGGTMTWIVDDLFPESGEVTLTGDSNPRTSVWSFVNIPVTSDELRIADVVGQLNDQGAGVQIVYKFEEGSWNPHIVNWPTYNNFQVSAGDVLMVYHNNGGTYTIQEN